MGVINQVIPKRRFEFIRDQIGAILADELLFQSIYDDNLLATVWVERVIKFDHTEIPAINVMLNRGMFSGQDQLKTDGNYYYTIDVYTKASSSEGVNGDSLALIRLHRLIGIIQSILEDTRYKTLGFTPPYIFNRHVEEIVIADPEQKEDMFSVVYGRLIFSVKASESALPVLPTLLAGNTTTVQLAESDKGFLYIYNDG